MKVASWLWKGTCLPALFLIIMLFLINPISQALGSVGTGELVAWDDPLLATKDARLVILGDSIAWGLDTPAPPYTAYGHKLAKKLETIEGRPWSALNYAKPGRTTRGLLNQVSGNANLRLQMNDAIVIVSVGGNNIIMSLLTGRFSGWDLEKAALQFDEDLNIMIDSIRLAGPRQIILHEIINPFPTDPQACQWVYRFNRVITSKGNEPVQVVPLSSFFNGQEAAYIAKFATGRPEDLLKGILAIHPNEPGHEAIASLLLPVILEKKEALVQ